jgi:hypothetical protein
MPLVKTPAIANAVNAGSRLRRATGVSQCMQRLCGTDVAVQHFQADANEKAAGEGGLLRDVWCLELAHQEQDQKHDDDEAKAATAVIAGAVEWAAADPAKSAEQGDNKNDQNDCANGHLDSSGDVWN